MYIHIYIKIIYYLFGAHLSNICIFAYGKWNPNILIFELTLMGFICGLLGASLISPSWFSQCRISGAQPVSHSWSMSDKSVPHVHVYRFVFPMLSPSDNSDCGIGEGGALLGLLSPG